MKNVTVSLDENVARWVRVRAATEGTSVSRFLADLLRTQMLDEASYENSMVRFLGRPPKPLKATGNYPSRDQLHDRSMLR